MIAASTVASGPADASTADARAVFAHLDVIERHVESSTVSRLSGWMVAEPPFEVVELALATRAAGELVRCAYPFHRGDLRNLILPAGRQALSGFTVLLPPRLAVAVPSDDFEFIAWLRSGDGIVTPFRLRLPAQTGTTLRIEPRAAAGDLPPFHFVPSTELSDALEARLLDGVAAHRRLWLRLDLINKCNLRCVMCHYSNEEFAKRPAQRLSPEEFFNFFEPIAPITREVVLSCGDEPLMSPHFEAIVREIAARDPEVRIRFCTNAMLMTEKIATAIIEANVHLVMFSFDGVTSETLHRIRVGSDYRRIVKNILYLRRLRAQRGTPNPRFVFNYVMLDSNIHEAPQFVRMARRLGADYIDFRHVVPFDYYDIEHEMLEYDQPKYNHYHQLIAATAAEVGLEVYLPPPFPTHAQHDASADPTCSLDEFHALLIALGEPVDLELAAPHPPEDENAPIPEYAHFFCDRPFSEVMIRDQKVYPCPWHREVLGTLDGETSLEEIFFGEKFRQVRLAMLDPKGAPGCAQCPIKSDYLPVRLAQRTP